MNQQDLFASFGRLQGLVADGLTPHPALARLGGWEGLKATALSALNGTVAALWALGTALSGGI